MRTIDDYIRLASEAVENKACLNGKTPKGLYDPIDYTLLQGGKRLRPVLLLAACEAVGGDARKALAQAAAIEMFHNFTLLHDDVMDCAEVRRGKPTVCKKWNVNTAILSGDAMLTLASDLMARDVECDRLVALLREFNATAMGVYEGQQYDMEFESRNDVTIAEYMEMIRLKTSVLLCGAARIGALMGGADSVQIEALGNYAENLGLAFQVQDDWLDVYGDSKVFGKAIGGDIMNNKKTFLLIKAMEMAKDADRRELDFWLGENSGYPGEKIAAVTGIYDRLGLSDICLKAVSDYSNHAAEALQSAGLSAEATDFFVAFDRMMMGRKK